MADFEDKIQDLNRRTKELLEGYQRAGGEIGGTRTGAEDNPLQVLLREYQIVADEMLDSLYDKNQQVTVLQTAAKLMAGQYERVEEHNTQLTHQVLELNEQVTINPMTGLLSESGFKAVVENKMASVRRDNRDREPGDEKELSVVYCDLRKFKPYNDTYGHDAGDEALRTFGRVLKSTIRGGDAAGHLHGDEFVLILDGGQISADAVIAKIKTTLQNTPVRYQGQDLPPVVGNFGYATMLPDDSVDTLIKRADAEMFKNKEQERPTVSWRRQLTNRLITLLGGEIPRQ